MKFLRTLREAG